LKGDRVQERVNCNEKTGKKTRRQNSENATQNPSEDVRDKRLGQLRGRGKKLLAGRKRAKVKEGTKKFPTV